MSLRDREVLDLLRDEPELLAIADAVSDTHNAPRQLGRSAVGAVALAAAAIFILRPRCALGPWRRREGSVLDRALAAIDSSGPVTHMTMRLDVTRAGHTFPSIVMESFYDKRAGLVRVVSRSDGKVLGDYTTAAAEDEFSFFPRSARGRRLLQRRAGERRCAHRRSGSVARNGPVYWVELTKGGGLILRASASTGTATGPWYFARSTRMGASPGSGQGARLRLRIRTLRRTSDTAASVARQWASPGPGLSAGQGACRRLPRGRGEGRVERRDRFSPHRGERELHADSRSRKKPLPRGSRQQTAAE